MTVKPFKRYPYTVVSSITHARRTGVRLLTLDQGNIMFHKNRDIHAGVVISITFGITVLVLSLMAMSYDIGRSGKSFEQYIMLLEKCSSGTDIRFNGKTIICRVAHSEKSLEAARHRAVISCINTLKRFEDVPIDNDMQR